MTISLLFTIAGGAWRWWDGQHHDLFRTWMRNVLCVALALGAACWSLGPTWPALWAAAWASLSIIAGYTKWESAPHMVARYGLPAAVAVLPVGGLGYVLACALAGAFYTVAVRFIPDEYQPEAIARVPAGAAIIGGLAWL